MNLMGNIHNFSEKNSLYNTFLAEIRDKKIQTDSLRFRKNIERMGEISAYEISKILHFESRNVETPLGIADMNLISDNIVVATVLRAGLPLHQGVLNYFDRAENCFISAYRKHTTEEDFDIEVEYMASPNLDGKIIILTDPMLASGASMIAAYKALLTKGKPAQIHVVSNIASEQGMKYVQENMPENTYFWIGAIDTEMNSKSYIIPGLGDAGDLAFGQKED